MIYNRYWREQGRPDKKYFICQECPGVRMLDDEERFYIAVVDHLPIFGVPQGQHVNYDWLYELHRRKERDTRSTRELHRDMLLAGKRANDQIIDDWARDEGYFYAMKDYSQYNYSTVDRKDPLAKEKAFEDKYGEERW
jgi:hypothetical protein